jgi:hypothetical protein
MDDGADAALARARGTAVIPGCTARTLPAANRIETMHDRPVQHQVPRRNWLGIGMRGGDEHDAAWSRTGRGTG